MKKTTAILLGTAFLFTTKFTAPPIFTRKNNALATTPVWGGCAPYFSPTSFLTSSRAVLLVDA